MLMIHNFIRLSLLKLIQEIYKKQMNFYTNKLLLEHNYIILLVETKHKLCHQGLIKLNLFKIQTPIWATQVETILSWTLIISTTMIRISSIRWCAFSNMLVAHKSRTILTLKIHLTMMIWKLLMPHWSNIWTSHLVQR